MLRRRRKIAVFAPVKANGRALIEKLTALTGKSDRRLSDVRSEALEATKLPPNPDTRKHG